MKNDDPIRRFTKRAKQFLEAAKAEARSRGEAGWEEPDFGEVQAIAGIALQLAMNEERMGSVPIPHVMVQPDQVRWYVGGYHLPGHLDESGCPVVCMLAPGVRRQLPPDSLPVAIIVQPGREADFKKTYHGGF